MQINRSRLLLWLRRGLLVVFTVIAYFVQNGIQLTGTAGLYLLIPLTVSIAMYEKEVAGMCFGLISGALWDISATASDGIYALSFALFACTVGFLCHYLLRNTLFIAFLLNLLITAFYTASVWVYTIWNNPEAWKAVLLKGLLPSFIITVLVLPLCYLPVYLTQLIKEKNTNLPHGY